MDGVEIPAPIGTAANISGYALTARDTPYDFHVVATTTALPFCSNDPVHKVVTVYDFPVFTLSADPDVTHACPGGEITFTPDPAFDPADFDYEWREGGIPNATITPSCTFTMGSLGNLEVGLQLTHKASGCVSPVVDHTITLHPEADWLDPAFTFTPDRQNICIDHLWELTAQINGTATDYTYEWTRTGPAASHNGVLSEMTHVVEHDPASETLPAGTYTYQVIATHNIYPGCTTATREIQLTSHAKPVVNIAGAQYYCETPADVVLGVEGEHLGSTYTWRVDGVLIAPNTKNITHTINTSRPTPYTFTVEVTAPDLNGACVSTADYEVTVNTELDPVTIASPTVDTICSGGQVTLTATRTNGVSGGEVYTWFRNGVLISGATDAILVDYPAAVDGDVTTIVYGVKVTQAASGCESAIVRDTITVYPNPTVVISGDPIVCEGTAGGVTLTANLNDTYPNSGLSFQWRLSNADIAGANGTTYTHTYPDSVNPYIFTVVVTNEYGCTTESVPFYQYVNSNPEVVVTATDTNICVGGEVTLTANLGDYNSPNLVYQWYTVSGATETAIDGATMGTLTVIPSDTTNYRVQ